MVDPRERLPLEVATQYVADVRGCSRTSARNWIEMQHPGYDSITRTVRLIPLERPAYNQDKEPS